MSKNSEVVSIFIDIEQWPTFYLNIMRSNPSKLLINSVQMYDNNNDIYSIKIPFLTFNLYTFGSAFKPDAILLETNIPTIINNGLYKVEIQNLTTPANLPTGYIIIYMTFYYD